jgi:hypothetical protein
MDGAKTRARGWKTLSSGRTAPLKPKPGLNGPPARRSHPDIEIIEAALPDTILGNFVSGFTSYVSQERETLRLRSGQCSTIRISAVVVHFCLDKRSAPVAHFVPRKAREAVCAARPDPSLAKTGRLGMTS